MVAQSNNRILDRLKQTTVQLTDTILPRLKDRPDVRVEPYLEHKLEIWSDALRANQLTPEERQIFALTQKMGNARKKKETTIDSIDREPVDQYEIEKAQTSEAVV